MKNLLLIILTVAILGCEQNKQDQPKAVTTQVHDSIPKYDTLSWNDLKIMGEIPLFTNPAEVKAKIGKADSITKQKYECGSFFYSENAKNLYVKGIEFESNNDSLVFRSVDFRKSDIFLSANDFRLDKNTTTEDLQKYFPNSFSHKMENERYGLGMVKSIQLKLTDYRSDDLWIMFFDDKKLIRIDYWIGC